MSCVDHFPLRHAIAGWLATGVVFFSAVGYAADNTYYEFKLHKAPELNIFRPQGTLSIELTQVQNLPNGNESGGIFRICDGEKWINKNTQIQAASGHKHGELAGFLTPAPGQLDQWDVTPEYVRLKLTPHTLYTMRIPLRIPPETITTSGYKTVSLAARPTVPFGTNCSLTQGVIQNPVDQPRNILAINIPVPNLHDATPNVPPLNSRVVKLNEDKKQMTLTVPISGAVEGNKVEWIDSSHPNGVAMTRGQNIYIPEDQTKGIKGVVKGADYSVTLPVPTHLDYTARIRVTKQVDWPVSKTVTSTFPMVTHTLNTPRVNLLNCSRTQCTLQWSSVLPYRDQDGSLGLNLKGSLPPINGTLPKAIFTLHPDKWETTGLALFDGQQATLLPVSNWRQYDENKGGFLTPEPLPREGIFIVRFEPKA